MCLCAAARSSWSLSPLTTYPHVQLMTLATVASLGSGERGRLSDDQGRCFAQRAVSAGPDRVAPQLITASSRDDVHPRQLERLGVPHRRSNATTTATAASILRVGSGFVMTVPQLYPRMVRRGAGVATVKPLPG